MLYPPKVHHAMHAIRLRAFSISPVETLHATSLPQLYMLNYALLAILINVLGKHAHERLSLTTSTR